MRTINAAGLALIKEFEGLKLEAYRCPAGVLTIGYGSTRNVQPGQRITAQQAEDFLRIDLARFEAAVDAHLTRTASSNAFSAFVSFAFNVGVGGFRKSTALKRFNDGDHEAAASALKWWNQGGGKVLPGLVRRREAEAKLMLTPDPDPFLAPEPAPQPSPWAALWAAIAGLFARKV